MKHHDVQAILIGDEAKVIAKAFVEAGFGNFEVIENATMPQVVNRAHELAQPGSVVILSPAAASFGLFKNYEDRGDQFVAAVNQLEN
jgi:UDP-N-acetylmuramoylalanine--D-glutamate ligase